MIFQQNLKSTTAAITVYVHRDVQGLLDLCDRVKGFLLLLLFFLNHLLGQ